jgi:hypothetical protein
MNTMNVPLRDEFVEPRSLGTIAIIISINLFILTGLNFALEAIFLY